MPRADVVAWVRARLASQINVTLPAIVATVPWPNPSRPEHVQYTHPGTTELRPVTNSGEDTLPAGWIVEFEDGKRGKLVAELSPGAMGQAEVELAAALVAGDVVTLPDGRPGKVSGLIQPGTTGTVIVETGETIPAGTQVEVFLDGTMGAVVADIQPGTAGQVEYVKFPAQQVGGGANPDHVLGRVDMVAGGRFRGVMSWDVDALATALEPGLPAVLPDQAQADGRLKAAQFTALQDHHRAKRDGAMEQVLQRWRDEGLI